MSCLSHRETMTMFERSFVRAQIKLKYSEGFNPRPRFCLPLPRNVGISSDDELMYGLLNAFDEQLSPEQIHTSLSAQMPEGCDILEVRVENGRVSYSAGEVLYVFSLNEGFDISQLEQSLCVLLDRISRRRNIVIERILGDRKGVRNIEVGKYILGARYEGMQVEVRCLITSGGTIRVDEILQLLGLNQRSVCGTVCRKSVQWIEN